jgi:hypothetical protein
MFTLNGEVRGLSPGYVGLPRFVRTSIGVISFIVGLFSKSVIWRDESRQDKI